MKPQDTNQSPKSYQFKKLPPPATPEWKRQRARLQSIGAARIGGRGRLVWQRFTLPRWAYESLRRLAAHFKVPKAVVIRCAVRVKINTPATAN